jgi:hypothetical protein
MTDETARTWGEVKETYRRAWHLTRDAFSLKLIYWAACVASPKISDRTFQLFLDLADSYMRDHRRD